MKALITGASSGIGRDIAKIYASKGYDLVIVARNLDKLIELKNELTNVNVEIVQMDLSIYENCITLHKKYSKEIDIFINNAGFGVCGRFTETSVEKEVNMINTNITAMHVLCKLFLGDMLEKNEGHILNVASIAGFMPGPLMASYYASKGYVVRLSQAIKEELKRDNSNVKISVLCPGPVDTNFNNVANVEFHTKSLSSSYVAKYAVEKMLNGKFYIVPSMQIKMLRIVAKIVPDSILAKFAYKIQERKIKR